MVKNILGMEIKRDLEENLVHLGQNKYINKQLIKFMIPSTPHKRKAVPITIAANTSS